MSNILQIKRIAAIVAFIITITIAMIFIDYSDLNFKTNLWQYSMIIISALGIIIILSDKKFTDNKKKKATIIIWFISLLYFIYIIVSYIIMRDSASLIFLALIILISTSLSAYNTIKNNKWGKREPFTALGKSYGEKIGGHLSHLSGFQSGLT